MSFTNGVEVEANIKKDQPCRGCGNRIFWLEHMGLFAQGYYDLTQIVKSIWSEDTLIGKFLDYPDLESDGGDGGRCDGCNANCVVNKVLKKR